MPSGWANGDPDICNHKAVWRHYDKISYTIVVIISIEILTASATANIIMINATSMTLFPNYLSIIAINRKTPPLGLLTNILWHWVLRRVTLAGWIIALRLMYLPLFSIIILSGGIWQTTYYHANHNDESNLFHPKLWECMQEMRTVRTLLFAALWNGEIKVTYKTYWFIVIFYKKVISRNTFVTYATT